MTHTFQDGSVAIDGGDASSVGYFIANAARVMRDMKRTHDAGDPYYDLHDGMGEDGAVAAIVELAANCVDYFNAKYLDEDGYWNVGVLDYDVWDSDTGLVTDEFYRVIVAIACGIAADGVSWKDAVDAYAQRMGWLPERGGEPLIATSD